MFKLDVTKTSSNAFEVCLHKEGYPIEDRLYVDLDTVQELVSDGDALLKGDTCTSLGAVTLSKSLKHGNAYQLTAGVNENYVRVFVLTEVELKLFLASLKRAIDG